MWHCNTILPSTVFGPDIAREWEAGRRSARFPGKLSEVTDQLIVDLIIWSARESIYTPPVCARNTQTTARAPSST
jgi:hypothetical protein